MAESRKSGRGKGGGAASKSPSQNMIAQNPLVRWVQDHPKTALGIALAAGVAVGMSPRARKGLVELVNRAASLMSS